MEDHRVPSFVQYPQKRKRTASDAGKPKLRIHKRRVETESRLTRSQSTVSQTKEKCIRPVESEAITTENMDVDENEVKTVAIAVAVVETTAYEEVEEEGDQHAGSKETVQVGDQSVATEEVLPANSDAPEQASAKAALDLAATDTSNDQDEEGNQTVPVQDASSQSSSADVPETPKVKSSDVQTEQPALEQPATEQAIAEQPAEEQAPADEQATSEETPAEEAEAEETSVEQVTAEQDQDELMEEDGETTSVASTAVGEVSEEVKATEQATWLSSIWNTFTSPFAWRSKK